MLVIQEPLFFVFSQPMLIWLPQMDFKWQDNWIQKVLELLVLSQKLILWIKVQTPREWSRERMFSLDLDLLVLKIGHNRILLIELVLRLPSRKNNFISTHILYIQLCHRIYLVLEILLRNLLKFCSLILSTRFRR